jgi:acylglycerol lipase
MALEEDVRSFVSGGRSLSFHSWQSATGRCVNVIHGLGEHGGSYGELAARCGRRGYSLFAMDLQGFGLSEGRRGHVRDVRTYLEDERTFLSLVASSVPAPRRILYGHSMGGLLALAYLESYPGDYGGAIISAPALDPAGRVSPILMLLGRIVGAVWPSCPMKNGIGSDELTGDEEARKSLREDTLRHPIITPRLFFGLLELSRRVIDDVDAIVQDTAILLLHGGEDTVMDCAHTRRLYERLDLTSKSLHILPGGRHDLLKDDVREKAYRIIESWLEARPS